MNRSFFVGDVNHRDQMVFGDGYDNAKYKFGGLRRFGSISAETMSELMEWGYLKEGSRQNSSPSAKEFYDFIMRQDSPGDWYAHGYAESPLRPCCSMRIEGIGKDSPPTEAEKLAFDSLCAWADEVSITDDGLYCWYD